MARIICHVRYRPESVTFVWSDGQNSFKPYALTGLSLAGFLSASAEANNQLSRLAAGEPASAALARAGHEIYQAIFPDDARGAVIREWFSRQEPSALEIVSDDPGITPWQAVYGQPVDDGQFAGDHPDAFRHFWGVRYPLASGGRASTWRLTPVLDSPRILAILDPTVRESLPDADRQRLQDLIAERQMEIVSSRAHGSLDADIVFILAPAADAGIMLDGETVAAEDLREALTEGGKPEPLLILSLVGSSTGAALSAFSVFQGVIGASHGLRGESAARFGLQLLTDMITGGQTAAVVLQQLRRQERIGLLYEVRCPAYLRLGGGDPDSDEPTPPANPLPETPYLPLSAYDREHRALFAGREQDLARCSNLLNHSATRLLVLQGGASVGKTSFLQAGLLPFLDDTAIGFLTLQDRTEHQAEPLVLRAADDLLGQLSSGLWGFCAQSFRYETPTGEAVEVDLPGIIARFLSVGQAASLPDKQAGSSPHEAGDLWSVLHRRPAALAELIEAIVAELPFELVVAVDHVEDLYTQVEGAAEQRERRQALQALARAAAAGTCKFILAVRSDFAALLLHELPRTPALVEHMLHPLSEQQMIDAVVLPTDTSPVLFSTEAPFARYQFLFEGDLPGHIVSQASAAAAERQVAVLPIVQSVCARLAALGPERPDHILRQGDIKEIGGIADAVDNQVRAALDALPLSSRTRGALRELCQLLYTRNPDGTLTRDLVPAPYLKDRWTDSHPIQQAVEAASHKDGLFNIERLLSAGRPGLFVSLKQDSLAQVAAHWRQEKNRSTFARKSVIDSLWIVIPLTLLVGSIGLFLWNRVLGFGATSGAASVPAESKKLNEQLAQQLDTQRMPLYAGQLARARQAWDIGNAWRANFLLANAAPEVRAFEWYYLWRETHREQFVPGGLKQTTTRVALSPDGLLAAFAESDGAVKLWDTAERKLKATLKPHAIGTTGLAFADDAKLLVTAGADRTIKLWDTGKLGDSAAPRLSLTLDTPVTALAVNSARGLIVAGLFNNQIVLADLAKGEQKMALKDHAGPVLALSFSADGATFASGDTQGTINVWKSTGEKTQTIKTSGAVQTLAMSSDGKLVAAGGVEPLLDATVGTVRIWQTVSGSPVGKPMEQGLGVSSIAFAPDGTRLLVGGKNSVIGVWDPEKSSLVGELRGQVGWVRTIAFSKDGSAIAASDESGLRIWSTSANPALFPFAKAQQFDSQQAHQGAVTGVAATKDGRLVISTGFDGAVKVWDRDGRLLTTLAEFKTPAAAVAVTGAKELIVAAAATAEKGGEIHLWKLQEKNDSVVGTALPGLKAEKAVYCLAFSPDGKLLAAGGAEQAVALWDHAGGKVVRTLKGPTATVRALAFEQSGKLLAAGGDDKQLRVWEVDSGKMFPYTDLAHDDAITSVLFYIWRAQGQGRPVVVTGGLDGAVMEWQLQTGKLNYLYRGHTNGILALTMTPDERVLLSASWDETIKAFDTQSGPERFTFTGHKAPVQCLTLAGEPQMMVSGDRDGVLRFWRTIAVKDAPMPPRAQGANVLPDHDE